MTTASTGDLAGGSTSSATGKKERVADFFQSGTRDKQISEEFRTKIVCWFGISKRRCFVDLNYLGLQYRVSYPGFP